MEVAWFADMTGSEMCKWKGGNEGKRRKGNVGGVLYGKTFCLLNYFKVLFS